MQWERFFGCRKAVLSVRVEKVNRKRPEVTSDIAGFVSQSKTSMAKTIY